MINLLFLNFFIDLHIDLLILLSVRYGCCSQALFSSDEMDFIVRFYVCSNVYTFIHYCVFLYDFRTK